MVFARASSLYGRTDKAPRADQMGAKGHNQGPSLPKSILADIDFSRDLRRDKRTKTHSSRKDARKQERLERKRRRADHHVAASKRRTEDEPPDRPLSKRRKTAHADSATLRSGPPAPPKGSHAVWARRPSVPSEAPKSKPTALERLASRSTRTAPLPAPRVRTREEAEEDAHIAYLEAKLGYANGSTRRKGDDADGLDDLLDFANGLEVSLFDTPDHPDADSNPDLSEDPDARRISDDGELSEVGQPLDDSSKSRPTDDKGEAESGAEGSGSGDEWTGFDASDTELPQHGEDAIIGVPETKPPGRYIPPGLRTASDTGAGEDTIKLNRQLKGLLNRMGEQNMSTILDGIEEVYRNNRRHDVTSALTTLVIDSISSHAMLLDSFVVLHAAFVSSLHRLIGVEFVTFVVQNVVSTYERHLREYESENPGAALNSEERGKECSNLVVLLSELYNFQVISCVLLYDVIKDLLGKILSEFRVELLLKVLRNSGQQLRQDDPLALKDIVTLAQSNIAGQGDRLSSRTRFMLETLANLKNNKTKKSAAPHQGGDAVERMKKFLSGLGKKRHVQAHEPLRVSLSDLRSAETKGRWWLVGAAWKGDPLVDQHRGRSARQNEVDAEDVGDTALAKLARKQGMNTDIRRSVFVVLMSSDDYVDACERLAQLNLSEVQQREIVRVVLHCCGNEKSYNPYYALVCQHLCQRSHAHKITLQYCLWDFLRDLGETGVGGAEVIKNIKDDGRFELKTISPSRIKNTAKAYGWWIAKGCCSIAILKPVGFTVLKPQARKFLRELFVQTFVASQASSPVLADDANEQASRNRGAVEAIFVEAIKTENLGLGLIFFLSHAFKGEEGLVKWACTVAKETLQTGMNEVPRP